jgi:hypothetical protein
MMGLSQGAPGPAEIIAVATKMALPDEAKRTLADIGSQLAALNDRRNEIGALQQKLDSDRKDIATLSAEVQQRSALLDDRDAALAARAAKFQAAVADFESKLAAHAATMESTS